MEDRRVLAYVNPRSVAPLIRVAQPAHGSSTAESKLLLTKEMSNGVSNRQRVGSQRLEPNPGTVLILGSARLDAAISALGVTTERLALSDRFKVDARLNPILAVVISSRCLAEPEAIFSKREPIPASHGRTFVYIDVAEDHLLEAAWPLARLGARLILGWPKLVSAILDARRARFVNAAVESLCDGLDTTSYIVRYVLHLANGGIGDSVGRIARALGCDRRTLWAAAADRGLPGPRALRALLRSSFVCDRLRDGDTLWDTALAAGYSDPRALRRFLRNMGLSLGDARSDAFEWADLVAAWQSSCGCAFSKGTPRSSGRSTHLPVVQTSVRRYKDHRNDASRFFSLS